MYIHIVVKDRNHIDSMFYENIDKIKERIPHGEVKIWDDELFEEFIKYKCGMSYMCFKRLNKKIGAMVADYIRYNVLYYYGGVYIDIKSGLKYDWDKFMDITVPDKLHVFEWDCKDFYEYINWFIVCDKDNTVMRKVIDRLNYKIINYDTDTYLGLLPFFSTKQRVLHFSGPRMFTFICQEYLDSDNIVLYPNEVRRKNLQYIVVKNYKKKYTQNHYANVKEEPLVI